MTAQDSSTPAGGPAVGAEVASSGDEATAMPRWLELQAEIDYRLFCLDEVRAAVATATDFEMSALRLAAQSLMDEMRDLRAEYDALESPTK